MLVVVLMLGTLAPVLANGYDDENGNGEENGPITTLEVTKNLRMNEGITLPEDLEDARFEFQLEFIEVNPALVGEVIFPNLDSGYIYIDDMNPVTSSPPTNVVVLTGSIDDLLAGIEWPSAGTYTFRLSEVANTSLSPDMIYDNAIYYVVVSVHTDAEGYRFVAGVYIMYERPSVLDDETGLFGSDGNKPEQVVFTNTFLRDTDLIISKTVDGAMGDQTAPFRFELELKSAEFSNRSDEDVYTAHIYEYVDEYCEIEEGYITNRIRVGEPITFVPGEPTEFSLRHGQMLVFTKLPVSTGWRVIEDDYSSYVTNIEVIENGVAFSVPGRDTDNRVLGEGVNSAEFTNTFDSVPITGLIAQNLPLILVGLAALGFITMTVANKRREATQE